MAKHRILIVGVGFDWRASYPDVQQTNRADLSICESNEQLRKTVRGSLRHHRDIHQP